MAAVFKTGFSDIGRLSLGICHASCGRFIEIDTVERDGCSGSRRSRSMLFACFELGLEIVLADGLQHLFDSDPTWVEFDKQQIQIFSRLQISFPFIFHQCYTVKP